VNESATIESEQIITVFTIGFTGKSAKEFFDTLQKIGVRRLIDIRLNNVSQLAGFTKRRDLEYFLQVIAGIGYVHDPELAPTSDILDAYKKSGIDWAEYERQFMDLLGARRPDKRLKRSDLDHACLLCSEPTANHCHRRLVAEYLQREWGNVAVQHL
jgi:uncharacterized protein (DUF488 family)